MVEKKMARFSVVGDGINKSFTADSKFDFENGFIVFTIEDGIIMFRSDIVAIVIGTLIEE